MENWKDLKDYEGFYTISINGEIKNRHGKTLTPWLDDGYLRVRLHKPKHKPRFLFIHRLLLIAFKGQPEPANLQVNHINGIKADNRLENLEWCTGSENIKHAFRTGLSKPSTHKPKPMCIIDFDQAQRIRKLKSEGISVNELTKMFSIKQGMIYRILANKSWKTANIF